MVTPAFNLIAAIAINMSISIPRSLILGLAIAVSANAAGESKQKANPASISEMKPTAADVAWMALKKAMPRGIDLVGPEDTADPTQRRAQHAKKLLADADQLRDFRRAHPRYPHLGEAKVMEAKALMRLTELGDRTLEKRRDQIVYEIRHDSTLARSVRFETAAYYENLHVSEKTYSSHGDKMLAYEKAARRLLNEFPAEPAAFESLVAIARDSSQDRMLSIARELVAGPAPKGVREQAGALIRRCSLIGKPVSKLVINLSDSDGLLTETKDRISLLYTWKAEGPSSVALARYLGENTPSGIALVGVNLGGSGKSREASQEATKLPGIQLNESERAKDLIDALELGTPGLVYLINRFGKIQDVAAHNNIGEVLASIKK